MKISYLADSVIPSRTANSVHVMKMCQAYARLGHQCSLIVPNRSELREPNVEDVFDFYGVERCFKLTRVPLPRLRSSTVYFALGLPITAALKQCDLVHTRNLASAWGSAFLLRRQTIIELHDQIPDHPVAVSIWNQLVRSPRVSVVLITRALEQALRPPIPELTRRMVAHDGVDRTWLDLQGSREEARKQLGLAPDSPTAVYTGGLYPGRGIELIEQIALVAEEIRFVIVGGQTAQIESLARRRLPPNVHLAGFVPPAEVRTYLCAADILLMPHAARVESVGGGDISRFTSPMKMFEYMSSGRPIVASTLPVLSEVLTDGVNCVRVAYEDLQGWLLALRRLIRDKSFANQLATQALADVSSKTWEARATNILGALTTS